MFLSLLQVNVGNDPDRPNPARHWLGDIYRVHQRLWMAFPDADRAVEDPFFLGVWDGPSGAEQKPKRGEGGFLFRIEQDGCPRILVQSAQRPNWEYAFQNAPYLLACAPKMKQVEADPKEGQVFRFRLLANVVRRKSEVHPSGTKRKTRSGIEISKRLRTEKIVNLAPVAGRLPADPHERQKVIDARWDPWRKWLEEMGNLHGFAVKEDEKTRLRMEAVHAVVRKPTRNNGDAARHDDKKQYNAGLFEGALVCTDPTRLRAALIAGIGHAKAFGFGLLSVAAV